MKMEQSKKRAAHMLLEQNEHERIKQAARHDKRSMSSFMTFAALERADQILGKNELR